MKLLYLGFLICLGIVILTTTIQGQGGIVIKGKVCLQVTNNGASYRNVKLKSYTEQTIPIEAILLTTKKGKVICANPKDDWVKKAVEELKSKNQKKTKSTKKPRKNKNGKRRRKYKKTP